MRRVAVRRVAYWSIKEEEKRKRRAIEDPRQDAELRQRGSFIEPNKLPPSTQLKGYSLKKDPIFSDFLPFARWSIKRSGLAIGLKRIDKHSKPFTAMLKAVLGARVIFSAFF